MQRRVEQIASSMRLRRVCNALWSRLQRPCSWVRHVLRSNDGLWWLRPIGKTPASTEHVQCMNDGLWLLRQSENLKGKTYELPVGSTIRVQANPDETNTDVLRNTVGTSFSSSKFAEQVLPNRRYNALKTCRANFVCRESPYWEHSGTVIRSDGWDGLHDNLLPTNQRW